MARQPGARGEALRWREELGSSEELTPADNILDRALAAAGIGAQAVPAGDPLLAGAYAVLDRDLGAIWYDASLPLTTRRFSVAHELAHWRLHDIQGPCGEAEIDPDPQEDALPFGEAYIHGYSPAQRRETEANVFAAELLAPIPALKRAYHDGLGPRQIAERIGIAETTVLNQLAEGLLLDGMDTAPSVTSSASPSLAQLDPSQYAAATVEAGPTLVVAGPGTGKTRTLTGRVEFLLGSGVAPSSILALTFSNRAANEMRDRLAASVPAAARSLWIGTFHAFGLEILRRFGSRIGLPASPRLLDPMDAISLMERRLPELELDEYEFLHDPMLPMRDLLGAISRAKDELKSPADYAALAARMAAIAEDEAAQREAVRAAEVARVYARWQGILQAEGLLDFGDLISRAVELLQRCPDVRDQLRSEYRQVLVDEYQDINRASAVLVKEIAGDGHGLWLVGDLRQAIYRFRGASPANIGSFETDYPVGRRVTLDVNYRSRPRLVQLFSLAANAIGRQAGAGWTAHRDGEEARVTFAEADDEWAQADQLAEYVECFREQGHRYQDQAILCRTNRQAEILAPLLEGRGVPIVYLGDVLARPEVKDLLALLSVACEGPQALRRVAEMPAYRISRDEVRRIAEQSANGGVLAALALSTCEGALKLSSHLTGLAYVGSAYAFLTRCLFGEADYLRRLAGDDSVINRQKRIAIHQLLALAREFQNQHGDREHPHRAFLNHIRRLLATGEEARVAVPLAASQIDGVRLMTVHAAKGLEFPVVFVPNLSEGMFPPRARGRMVRLPVGLADADGTEAEEEERLFFVALSRARDHLVLSFPRRLRGREVRPSPLLALIRQPLASVGATIEHWSSVQPDLVDATDLEPAEIAALDAALPLSAVEMYLRCPRQYYYRHLEQTAEPENERPYRILADSVRRLVLWYQKEAACGASPAAEQIAARADEIWAGCSLGEHTHAALFRRRLDAVAAKLDTLDSAPPDEWTVRLESGSITLRPDGILEDSGAIRVERHHLGRESDSHRSAPTAALLRAAAEQQSAGKVQIVNRYLATGETVEVPASRRYEPARVQRFERGLQGIRAGRFDPAPADPNECNRCPFFLVCPH